VSTSVDVLRSTAVEFAAAVGSGPWQVAWCAGAGVTGTTQEVLDDELDVLRRFLEALADVAVTARGQGSLFLASSAGGVYAGAAGRGGPPYDERTPPRALAPYGQAKIRAEAMVREWAGATGVPVAIGRISNLYGPGQNLAKPQGLISQMCRAHLTGQPLSVYVPLDTLRDYVYAADCGALVRDMMQRSRWQAAVDGGVAVHVKVLASQRAVTVGAVIAELRRLFKRAPLIVLGASSAAAQQARDLRLRSVVWRDLDARPLTPLPVGMKATAEHLRRQLQLARIRRSA
jgi:UDP-glucose 4-epimerase